MPRVHSATHTAADLLELIQSQFQELRQAESLEMQIHEMVVAKRHKLDSLMTEFLSAAANTLQMAPKASLPQTVVSAPQSTVAAPAPEPKPVAPVEDLPLAHVPSPGSPRDLLQQGPYPAAATARPAVGNAKVANSPGLSLPSASANPANGTATYPSAANPNAANPSAANPSAQQVLDSLNRLMSGLKEISHNTRPV